MIAWQVRELGAVDEVLRLREDVVVPVPTADEVAIEVRACALNFADSLLCAGTYQEHPPLPFTPGLELAGVVVAAGPDATHAIGDRVAGSPWLPHGGLAARAIARSAQVFRLDDDIDDDTAAAMHVTYQTAWFALQRRAHLRAGDTLLVHAAAGGVGSAAVEIGLAAGATVIATAGGPDKAARVAARGVARAIDYRAEDFVAVVNELTDGRGADVIFDSVNGDTFTRSTKCIAWEGSIVVIGAAGGRYVEARTNHALVKNYGILGLNWRGYLERRPELVADAHVQLTRLLKTGALHPDISERLSLTDDVPAAISRLTGGSTTGKLVVHPH
jgi:NADPH2:quinone reductase